MRLIGRDTMLWAPRALGLSLVGLSSLLATDAFTNAHGNLARLTDFAIGLIPALIVLAVVTVGWKREGIAAVIFIGLAGLYAFAALRHPSWILVVAVPLFVVGVLFFVSWRVRRSGDRFRSKREAGAEPSENPPPSFL